MRHVTIMRIPAWWYPFVAALLLWAVLMFQLVHDRIAHLRVAQAAGDEILESR